MLSEVRKTERVGWRRDRIEDGERGTRGGRGQCDRTIYKEFIWVLTEGSCIRERGERNLSRQESIGVPKERVQEPNRRVQSLDGSSGYNKSRYSVTVKMWRVGTMKYRENS